MNVPGSEIGGSEVGWAGLAIVGEWAESAISDEVGSRGSVRIARDEGKEKKKDMEGQRPARACRQAG